MVPSKDQTATLIREAFVKAIEPKVKLEDKLEDKLTARWVKAGQTTGGEYNVLQELQAAIANIVEYLESSAGKRFLETKTDIDNPNKIANLFDDAVAGVNALIGNLFISNAKELKEQIYTQLVDAVSKQYPGYKLTGQDVKNAAKKSEAELVTKLDENNIKVECGGAGNCGPLSILGALNMAGMAVSDPALQKVINSFKKDDHEAATELRKALVAYIKKTASLDREEKSALFMVPIGASIDKGIMTGNAEEGYFYKPEAYFKDLLNINHWFSDAEMNLVAKMLNINIVVAVQGLGGTTIQRKETQGENPAGTIYLYNYDGMHYQAYPESGEATIAPRTTSPLSATREPEPEPELERSLSPSPTLTLKEQAEAFSRLTPKELSTKELENLTEYNNFVLKMLIELEGESPPNPENIKRTLEEAYDLAMLALQDERANIVFGAINLIFNKKGEIPNKTYVQFARKKIDALDLEEDDPIKIALKTAVEAAQVTTQSKLNSPSFTTTLTPAALGSSSSLSVSEEDRNPGFVYLNPILNKTITPTNNEKKAVAKMKDCFAMLEKLLIDNPHMKPEKIAELQTLFLDGSAGEISVAEFKRSFEEILTDNIDVDDPTGLLEGFKSREDTIFNYVEIIAKSKLTSSLPILEQAFVIPKEMNNKSDLEKSEFLLDKFGATLEVIQETIKLEHPVFAMWSEEFCEQIEKFVKGDEDADDLEDIEGLFGEVLKKSDIPPALETILEANRCYITEALTRIQDSRDNAVTFAATLKSNDPKLTNDVFEIFLNKYYGEFGPSKEFRSIKDPSGSITLHNRTKGDNYEPTPLVTFTPSTKPATAGVVPFADCKFTDIYAGARAAFIVMSKFKAENPSAECSVDNPKLNSDADYKNFLQALYDATKSADGKYMMNEVKINFTDDATKQEFINILSGARKVGLADNVVAALKDNFGPSTKFKYPIVTSRGFPPKAKIPDVTLKTQCVFTDDDYKPKSAVIATAPTTSATPIITPRSGPGSSTSSL